jgi:allophanate hydrolase
VPLPTSETGAVLVSAGVVPGAIQVPPSGLPIILLLDGPTIGGYPVPAVVSRADLPIVAQRAPGDRVMLVAIEGTEARMAARARRQDMSGALRAV